MKPLGQIISGENEHLEWSAICHPMYGEDFCGDDFLVTQHGRKTLVAVIDGLGHGREALNASGKALTYLNGFRDESLITLMSNCHEHLKQTRGAVMSMALFDNEENIMSWMGVGNVEGILFRAQPAEEQSKETILLRGGVVGYNLPQLKASMLTIQPADTLIFTTDGVGYGYAQHIKINKSTAEIAQYISSNFVDKNDDAQILVARYKQS